MIGILWAISVLITGLIITVFADMARQEIHDRFDHIPHAILRLAACRLTPDQQTTVYHDEWLPELTYILTGNETRPISRFITGITYAAGILIKTRVIARHLRRPAPATPQTSSTSPIESKNHVLTTLHDQHRTTQAQLKTAESYLYELFEMRLNAETFAPLGPRTPEELKADYEAVAAEVERVRAWVKTLRSQSDEINTQINSYNLDPGARAAGD